MSAEVNEVLVRSFYGEFSNAGNPDVADEPIAPDRVFHVGGNPGPIRGPEGHKERTLAMPIRSAFPDIRRAIEDTVAEGDRVAERPVGGGTHLGGSWASLRAASGSRCGAFAILRMAEGKIVESRGVPYAPGPMRQLGVAPVPKQTTD